MLSSSSIYGYSLLTTTTPLHNNKAVTVYLKSKKVTSFALQNRLRLNISLSGRLTNTKTFV